MDSVREFIAFYLSFFESSPVLYTTAAMMILVIVSLVLHFIFKRILLKIVQKVLSMTGIADVGYELINRVATRLANIAPATAYTETIHLIPNLSDGLVLFIRHTAASFIVLSLAMAVAGVFDIINALYNRRSSAERPIRGYIQLLKLAVYLIAVILIVSLVFNKSPILLLSGLGAVTAVLILVFQDTLLSLVASIQISANGYVRVGDWIEIPSIGVDGTVVDLALHTVRVQNLDRTETTFPVRKLVTEAFKNWRPMQESNGRRIKRAIYLDQSSIHFLTAEEDRNIHRLPVLKSWLEMEERIQGRWDGREVNDKGYINSYRQTNVTVFRAYIEQYLNSHPEVDKEDLIMARQLDPGPTGMPIEVYCFLTTSDWHRYESVQADIIDHFYAVLPEFGLAVYQRPSGRDLEAKGFIVEKEKRGIQA